MVTVAPAMASAGRFAKPRSPGHGRHTARGRCCPARRRARVRRLRRSRPATRRDAALDPRVIRARRELGGGHNREAALPRERLLLRAEPHFDEAVLQDRVGRQHVFARQQRHAQRDGFAHGREPRDGRMHLPDQAKLEAAIDHGDRLHLLPVVARRAGSGLLLEREEDLRLGHTVGFHAGEGPTRRVDLHLPRLEQEGPLHWSHSRAAFVRIAPGLKHSQR